MKAVHNKILVRSYANQKDTINITGKDGKLVQLWIGKQYVGNNRERNPVLCEVIDNASEKYDYIKAGDKVLLHHNYCSDWKTNPFCIEYDLQTGEGLYAFELNESVFCKINNDGELEAVCDNLIVERIEEAYASEHIIIPESVKKKAVQNVKVLSVAPEIKHIKVGDVVGILPKADYEICYTFNKKEYKAIKVFSEFVWGKLVEVAI